MMNTYSLTLNQIKAILKNFFDKHIQVHTVIVSNRADFDSTPNIDYPVVHIESNNALMNGNQKTYNFLITIADIQQNSLYQKNVDQIQNDAHLISQDFFTYFRDYEWFEVGTYLTIEPFEDSNTDRTAGVTFGASITTIPSRNICDVEVLLGGASQPQPQPSTSTNLSLGVIDQNTITIDNSNGTGVTIPKVNNTSAGLMTAEDKVLLDKYVDNVETTIYIKLKDRYVLRFGSKDKNITLNWDEELRFKYGNYPNITTYDLYEKDVKNRYYAKLMVYFLDYNEEGELVSIFIPNDSGDNGFMILN